MITWHVRLVPHILLGVVHVKGVCGILGLGKQVTPFSFPSATARNHLHVLPKDIARVEAWDDLSEGDDPTFGDIG